MAAALIAVTTLVARVGLARYESAGH
jgi:hypothetical protein